MFHQRLAKVLLGVIAVVVLAAHAHAQTLFLDNFTVSQNDNDVNRDYANGTRQTGTLAPSPYTPGSTVADFRHQVGNPGSPGALLLAADTTTRGGVSNNKNFNIAAPVLRLSFDANPASNGGIGITFGTAVQNPSAVSSANTGQIGLLYGASGGYQLFKEGTQLAGVASGNGAGSGSFTNIRFDIIATDGVSAFNGHDATVNLYIGNSSTPTYSFTQAGGFTNDYISFLSAVNDSNLAVSLVDNFQVVAVPELGTAYGVVALLGGLAIRRIVRRRRATVQI